MKFEVYIKNIAKTGTRQILYKRKGELHELFSVIDFLLPEQGGVLCK